MADQTVLYSGGKKELFEVQTQVVETERTAEKVAPAG